MMSGGGEQPDGVSLTNLDQPLFDGADATKRDLVDYLDAVADHIIPELADRPLSVVRVLRGQTPFMQKNVPSYTPSWVRTVSLWAETSKREVSYALCNDRRTLLWFANQRAVEYHPTLFLEDRWDRVTHLVLDLDPPADGPGGAAGGFRQAVASGSIGTNTCTPFAPLVLTTPANPASARAWRTRCAARTATPNVSPDGGSRSSTRWVGRSQRSARIRLGWYSTARWLANHSSVRRSLQSA